MSSKESDCGGDNKSARSATRDRRSSRRWLRLKGKRELPPFTYTLLGFSVWLLRRTLWLDKEDPYQVLSGKRDQPVIFAVWHNRLLLMPLMTSRRMRRKMAVLASYSRDGEYAARYMRFFGFRPVRGSSSRGGVQALRVLKRELEAGFSIGLTPDGPRGPRYEVQLGAVALAQMTGAPIVPVCLNANRCWQLKGWDRTQIPKPFSRVKLLVGKPIICPGKGTEEERRDYRRQLQFELDRITEDLDPSA